MKMAKAVAAVKNSKVEKIVKKNDPVKSAPVGKYWETAPDVEVRTEKGAGIRVWVGADKLQVQQDMWENKATGEMCPGKVVSLKLSELAAVLKQDKAVVKAVMGLLK